MRKEHDHVWSWIWPEWCLIFMCFVAIAFSLFWHIVVRDGASFFFMGGISEAQSGWQLFWMRGVSERPYEWWHGFGLTVFPTLLALIVIFYIPFRIIHWAGARAKGNIHNKNLDHIPEVQ